MQGKEAVFIEKLANRDGCKKLTLSDMLLVLEKCIVSPRRNHENASRFRQEATQHLRQYRPLFEPNSASIFLSPNHLTRENIDWFRNRASHIDEIDIIDASIGRFLARRISGYTYRPVLKSWGFQPRLFVWELVESRSDFTDEHTDTLIGIKSLADAYRTAGRLADALSLYEEALELKRRRSWEPTILIR